MSKICLLEGFVVFCSFQFCTTSSQTKSVRIRWMIGSLGFFVANKNPLCLKLTISPLAGTYFRRNSVVAGGASKCIPFGLCTEKNREESKEIVKIKNIKKTEKTYNSHSHKFCPIGPTILASASLNL